MMKKKKMSHVHWIWQYYYQYRVKFLTLVIISTSLTVLLTRSPKLIGNYVEKVFIQGDSSDSLWILVGIVAIALLNSIGRYFYLLEFQRIAQDVIFKIRRDLYEKIQNMDQKYVKENRTGTLMSRMIGDTQVILNFLAFGLQEIFINCILFVVILAMMFTVNPFFFLSFLTLTPFLLLVATKHSKNVRPGFIRIREQYANLNTVVQENISGNRVVRAFMNEEFEYTKFNDANRGFMDANLESVKVWSRFVPILDATGLIMNAVLILVGGVLYSLDAIVMSDIVQMAAYVVLLDRPMRSFGWTINKIEQLSASTTKIRELMSVEVKLLKKVKLNERIEIHKKLRSHKEVEQRIKGDIVFDNVSFGYGQGSVVTNFNLYIQKGKTIALVGATGSGKSTIIDLLARFEEVSSGEIRIDHKSIKDYDIRYLRGQMALSMQNVFLFSDTIENNIRYGISNANEEEVRRVADISGVHEFVRKMPDRYETVVGENGVGLSGGQKQRIALARALIKDPSILILDDTTSSVDMETEYKIHKGLKDMNSERTTILVAHRISSIKHADKIVVMEKGRIIEIGTHKQLLHNKAYYYQVLKNQMGDFDIDLAIEELRGGTSA